MTGPEDDPEDYSALDDLVEESRRSPSPASDAPSSWQGPEDDQRDATRRGCSKRAASGTSLDPAARCT